jgi:hypothetical protein
MNHLLAPKHEIIKEAEIIQEFLQEIVSEDINEIEQRGHETSAYIARTGKLLADAKYYRDQAIKDSILNRMNNGLPASTLNKLIESDCEEENYMVNWLDRLNRSATHHCDWLRSCMSKAKEEMRMGGFST